MPLYFFDDWYTSFECYLLTEHIDDDSRSLVEMLPEYRDHDDKSRFWVNNEYLTRCEGDDATAGA